MSIDHSKRWYFPYAFPTTLPGSFCLAASSLMPGARDKDKIGEIISRSVALDAPHVVSALSGYAISHYPLMANLLVLAASGFLNVSECPIWIEHDSAETVDYLDQVRDGQDKSILDEPFVGLGRTGYCFFVPDDRPELTGIAFVCSSRTMDRMMMPSSRPGESLSFLPYIAYIDRTRLAKEVEHLTPTRLDRYSGRLYAASKITSFSDVENILIEASKFAPLNDIMADAKVLNLWTDAEQATYVEQSFRAVSNALPRAIACLVLLQLPDVTLGLPGGVALRTSANGETEAYWRPKFMRSRIHPRVINMTPNETGQIIVRADDYPEPEPEPKDDPPAKEDKAKDESPPTQ